MQFKNLPEFVISQSTRHSETAAAGRQRRGIFGIAMAAVIRYSFGQHHHHTTAMRTVTLLSVLAATAGFACAQQEKKDPIADIKAQVKDPAKPFSMIVEFHIKPGTEKEFRKVVQDSVKNTKQEPGNAAYACHQDAKDPTRFVFVELWRSVAALEAHIQQPYVKALLGKAEEVAAEPPAIRVLTPWVPGPPKEKPSGGAAPAPGPEKKEAK